MAKFKYKMTEEKMQARLMWWVMNDLHHLYTVPNSTVIFHWESDLISVTQALFTHEYEIKISMSDYRKDDLKKWKHMCLKDGLNRTMPNYFWYATCFDIEPPPHAGWIKISGDGELHVEVKKPAPRLTDSKMSDQTQFALARLLSFRLTNFYQEYIYRENQAACRNTPEYEI
jgi:hypothetical protein